MKTGNHFIALALLVLVLPLSSSAQHHHYKVIEIGTFGGPNFYSNFSGAQDRLLNNRGTFVGAADTSVVDPYCFGLFPLNDCFAEHAFTWRDGVLTDRGTLPGGTNSNAFWINDAGVIAGLAQNGDTNPVPPLPWGPQVMHAVIWKQGKVVDLGTLGGPWSLAQAINNRGQVVGIALNNIPDSQSLFGGLGDGFLSGPGLFVGTQMRAFLWENGVMHDLGTLGGPDAWARFVNERGQVVGVSFTDSTVNPATGTLTTHSFLWEDGKMADLGNLGGTLSDPQGLNNRGQVVGEMTLPGDMIIHPFFWDDGKLTDLGTFGGDFGLAIGLNEAGEVVGTATTPGNQSQYAFLWKDGVMSSLGTAPGDDCSVAQQVNARGQAVGPSFPCSVGIFNGADDATLFDHGAAINLNDFVPPGSDIHLTGDDSYINDGGEIAVAGVLSNADNRAFLLIPCDEEHPQVEGCDYSPFDPSIAPVHAALPAGLFGQAPTPANLTPGEISAQLRSIGVGRRRRFGAWPPK